MRAREGDLIRTSDNVIFDVKGLVHPHDKIIAFPRYIPSREGQRRQSGNLYGKVYNLAERFQYLQRNAPQLIVADPVFGENLCEVPVSDVVDHYEPAKKLAALHKASHLAVLERKAVLLAETLKKTADVPWSNVGISGSILARLFTLQSDIDPIVYGAKNCRKANTALHNLLDDRESHFKRYATNELRQLFEFRSKDTIMSFEDFEKVEGRKAFQGKFEGVDYFVRFVKDWAEVGEKYGDVCFENVGYAKITGTVADDSEALFTPCTYHVEDVRVVEGPPMKPIEEVVSFRGRFCEQAQTGEGIVAQGKIERVTDTRSAREYYRLILGNKPQDYMVLSH